MSILEEIIEIPVEHEQNVFGQFDAFAKKIERTLHVTLIARDGKVKILGDAARVSQAKRTLTQLTALSEREYNHRAECRLCAIARIGRSGSGDCGD